jgi:hypothetical protein
MTDQVLAIVQCYRLLLLTQLCLVGSVSCVRKMYLIFLKLCRFGTTSVCVIWHNNTMTVAQEL